MKVILNKCYGGFSFSQEAVMMYGKAIGVNYRCVDGYHYTSCSDEEIAAMDEWEQDNAFVTFDERYRYNPVMIKIVEQLGERANTECSLLKVVDIPDEVEYTISDNDGIETLYEKCRRW